MNSPTLTAIKLKNKRLMSKLIRTPINEAISMKEKAGMSKTVDICSGLNLRLYSKGMANMKL